MRGHLLEWYYIIKRSIDRRYPVGESGEIVEQSLAMGTVALGLGPRGSGDIDLY